MSYRMFWKRFWSISTSIWRWTFTLFIRGKFLYHSRILWLIDILFKILYSLINNSVVYICICLYLNHSILVDAIVWHNWWVFVVFVFDCLYTISPPVGRVWSHWYQIKAKHNIFLLSTKQKLIYIVEIWAVQSFKSPLCAQKIHV